MKFVDLFNSYLSKSGLTKKEVADRIGVTDTYIINISKGRAEPPNSHRIDQIIEIFRPTKHDADEFHRLAEEERLPEEARKYIRKYCSTSSPSITDHINGELSEALKDPEVKDAVKQFIKLLRK